MARYIDADKIHQLVNETFKDDVPYEWAWTLTAIDNRPTADVVEVVRCKDCKYYCFSDRRNPNAPKWCGASREYNEYPEPNDFCSYGEREDT